MIDWLSSDVRSAGVAAWGFVITVLGFMATLAGLWYTYRQARSAALAAQRATAAVESFKVRMRREAASRDVAMAVAALEETIAQLSSEASLDAVHNHEPLRKAIIRINTNLSIPDADKEFLDGLHDHILSFSEEVAIFKARKGKCPDSAKAARYMKECHLNFAKLDANLTKDV